MKTMDFKDKSSILVANVKKNMTVRHEAHEEVKSTVRSRSIAEENLRMNF